MKEFLMFFGVYSVAFIIAVAISIFIKLCREVKKLKEKMHWVEHSIDEIKEHL